MQINLNEFGGVIAALMLIGAILKHAMPGFPTRFIPLATWVLGVVAYLAITNDWRNPQAYIEAVVAAATATGLHSGIKNTFESEDQKHNANDK